MVMKMLTKLRKRMVEHSENFNKEIKNIRRHRTEVTELKNTVTLRHTRGVYSTVDEVEEQVSKLEGKAMELTQTEEQTKKKKFKK